MADVNQNQNNEEIEIDLMELLGVLLSKWWLIILVTMATAIVGFCVSAFLMTPKYQSTTDIYILNTSDGDKMTTSDTTLATQLTSDYKELIVCRYVLETVIEQLNLPDTYGSLKNRVSVSNASNTRIIYITVTDPSPYTAQAIANAIREVASVHIQNVIAVQAVNVVDEANLPTSPSEPSVMKFTVLGAGAGFVLVCGILLVIFLLDDTIKTTEDVEKYLGLSTLAMIPVIQDAIGADKRSSSSSSGSSSGKKEVKKKSSSESGSSRSSSSESGSASASAARTGTTTVRPVKKKPESSSMVILDDDED